MNEDELINIVEIAIDKLRFWENHGWISKIENKEVHEYKEAIQGLLDLYEKAKEDVIKQYELGLTQGAYEKDLVWKDKIRDKIKYYEIINDEVSLAILESLLEEE